MTGAVRHPLHDRVVQAMSTRAITASMVAAGILAAMSMSLAPSAMGAVAKPAKVLFVQQASSASVEGSGVVRQLSFATTGRFATYLDERPGRKVGKVSKAEYARLWQGPFRRDNPNAVLSGRGLDGRHVVAVVRLTSWTYAAGRNAYGMRILSGTVPATVSGMTLVIDDVPYPSSTEMITSTDPLVLNAEQGPVILNFSTLTFAAGAGVNVALPPMGATFTMDVTSDPTCGFADLFVVAGLTSTPSNGGCMYTVTLPPPPTGSPTLVLLNRTGSLTALTSVSISVS